MAKQILSELPQPAPGYEWRIDLSDHISAPEAEATTATVEEETSVLRVEVERLREALLDIATDSEDWEGEVARDALCQGKKKRK